MIEFLLYSNLYLACGTAIVAYASTLTMGCVLTWKALFLPFANGFFIYTLNRYTDRAEDRINVPGRVRFFERHGLWFLLASATTYLIALVFAFREGLLVALLLVTPLAIGLLYSFAGLKKLVFGKNLAVGLAWGSTTLLAAAFCDEFPPTAWLLFAFFSLEFFANTIIFDVKDIQGDRSHGIRTLPVVLGLARTKTVCHALNGSAIALVFACVSMGLFPPHALILAVLGAYILVYTHFCSETRGRLFYGLFVDGEFLFLLCAYLWYAIAYGDVVA